MAAASTAVRRSEAVMRVETIMCDHCECSLTTCQDPNPRPAPAGTAASDAAGMDGWRGAHGVASGHGPRCRPRLRGPIARPRQPVAGRCRAGLQPRAARLPPRGRAPGAGGLGRRTGRLAPSPRRGHGGHMGGLVDERGRPACGGRGAAVGRRPADRTGRTGARRLQPRLQRRLQRHPVVLPPPPVRLGPAAADRPAVDGRLGRLPHLQPPDGRPGGQDRHPKGRGSWSRTTTSP